MELQGREVDLAMVAKRPPVRLADSCHCSVGRSQPTLRGGLYMARHDSSCGGLRLVLVAECNIMNRLTRLVALRYRFLTVSSHFPGETPTDCRRRGE